MAIFTGKVALRVNTSLGVVIFSVLGLGACLGCSSREEGPTRYRVSGTVQFDGQPVPYGSVIFNPDSASGNSGPQGSAEIINGKYDTSVKGGTVGGMTEITVMGYSKQQAGDGEDPGMLFNSYSFTKELPKATAVENIEVPKMPVAKAKAKKK